MAKLTAHHKVPGANAGAEVLSRLVELDSIKTDSDFESLFPIHESTLQQVVERMQKYGFDKSQPLIIVKYGQEEVLGDGHTRRKAAKIAGIRHVPIVEQPFESKADALEFVLGLQTARRNLNDAELVAAILKLDQLKNKGRKSDDSEEKGKSAATLAKMLHTSTTKVEKFRAVEKKASEEVKQAVRTGDMTINKAYEMTRQKMTDEQPHISAEQDSIADFEKTTGSDKPVSENLSTAVFMFPLEQIFLLLCKGKMFPAVKLLLKELKISPATSKQLITRLPNEYQIILSKLTLGETE